MGAKAYGPFMYYVVHKTGLLRTSYIPRYGPTEHETNFQIGRSRNRGKHSVPPLDGLKVLAPDSAGVCSYLFILVRTQYAENTRTRITNEIRIQVPFIGRTDHCSPLEGKKKVIFEFGRVFVCILVNVSYKLGGNGTWLFITILDFVLNKR